MTVPSARAPDDHRPAALGGPRLRPPDVVAVDDHLAEPGGGADDELGGDRGRPAAVGETEVMSVTLGPRRPVRDTSPRLPDPGGRGDYRPTHACPHHVDAPAGVLPGPLRFDGGEQEAAAGEALHRQPPARRRKKKQSSGFSLWRRRRRRLEPARPRRRRPGPLGRPPGGGRAARARAPPGRRRPGRAGPGDRARRGRVEQRHRPGRRAALAQAVRWIIGSLVMVLPVVLFFAALRLLRRAAEPRGARPAGHRLAVA